MDSKEVYLSRIKSWNFSQTCIYIYIYIPPIMVAEKRPLNEGREERGMDPHFFWNRTFPGMLSWKFDPVSFPKRSKLFLDPFGIPIITLGALENFKFVVLRLLEKTKNCESKNVFRFCSFPQAKLSPRQKEITHFTRIASYKNLFFLHQKRVRIMELKKRPRLNLWRHWSQLLTNSIIFATFTFLISVLLYHNLD